MLSFDESSGHEIAISRRERRKPSFVSQIIIFSQFQESYNLQKPGCLCTKVIKTTQTGQRPFPHWHNFSQIFKVHMLTLSTGMKLSKIGIFFQRIKQCLH